MKNIYLFIITFTLLGISCNHIKTKPKKKNNATKANIVDYLSTEIVDSIRYISAESGLNYRKTPRGKVIGKFELNEIVTVVKNTGKFDDIKDNDKLIQGEWVGVKKNKDTVYVFDGYLTKKKVLLDEYITKVIVNYYNKNYGGDLSGLVIKNNDKYKSLKYIGEEGYALMHVDIPLKINNKFILYGDLNNDNNDDMIIPVYTEGGGGGGNAWWVDLFIYLKKDDKYSFLIRKTNWEVSGCNNRGFLNINDNLNIENNKLYSQASCYDDEDGQCCPSLNYDIILKIKNNDFVVIDSQFKSKNQ